MKEAGKKAIRSRYAFRPLMYLINLKKQAIGDAFWLKQKLIFYTTIFQTVICNHKFVWKRQIF